jgi:hypothetical protein
MRLDTFEVTEKIRIDKIMNSSQRKASNAPST